MKDYYYILGINSNAKHDEVRTAFRKLSQIYHPDKNNNDPYYAKLFFEISEAYNVLIDSELRKEYDEKRNDYYSTTEVATISKRGEANVNKVQNKKDFSSSKPNFYFFLIILLLLFSVIILIRNGQLKTQVSIISDSLKIELRNLAVLNSKKDTIKIIIEQLRNLQDENYQLREKNFLLSTYKQTPIATKPKIQTVEIINSKGFDIELRNLGWQESYRSNESGARFTLIQLSIYNKSEECFSTVICDFKVVDESGIPVNSGYFFLNNNSGDYICKGEAKEINVLSNLPVFYRKGQRIQIIINNLSYRKNR